MLNVLLAEVMLDRADILASLEIGPIPPRRYKLGCTKLYASTMAARRDYP